MTETMRWYVPISRHAMPDSMATRQKENNASGFAALAKKINEGWSVVWVQFATNDMIELILEREDTERGET
jgi:hypothetical protein